MRQMQSSNEKIGDYSIATTQGKPPAPIFADLQSQAESTASTPGKGSQTTTPGAKGPQGGKPKGRGRS